MNVFEFTQALRRQRRFLMIGGLLLGLAVFLMTFQVSGSGVEARVGPRYTTSVRMVVAPADTSSLRTAPTSDAMMAETAAFFATLLTSPEASLQIQQETGVGVDEMTVTADGVVITVATTAATAEDAVATALGAFDWLTDRVDEPLELHDVSPEGGQQSPDDADGTLTTTLVIDASPAFATDGVGLWVTVLSAGEVIESVSLADAAIETGAGTTVVVPTGGDLTVQLEDVDRSELDRATLEIPPAPIADGGPHELVVSIDRGSLTGLPVAADGESAGGTADLSAVDMEPERIDLSWRQSESALLTPASRPVGLVLLTEDPIPLETGARRGPMIFLGALLGGAFALITIAIAIDGWRQAYRTEASSRARTRLANIHPIREDAEAYRASGPLSSMVSTVPDSDPATAYHAAERDPQ